MSNGQYHANIVVRTPGGTRGGTGPHHSQCLEALFMHVPGLQVAVPASPYDAKGLLKTAIHNGEPVLFFEHKMLYKLKGDVPEEEYTIPFGQGRIIREGNDLTVVAVSNMVTVAREAAVALKEQTGLDVEIIDPRTLVPLDMEMIGESVKKTHKAVILEEGVLRGGVGSEITARINDTVFDWLDFPVKRIAARNMPIPMTPHMEQAVLPGKDRVVQEIRDFLGREVWKRSSCPSWAWEWNPEKSPAGLRKRGTP